MTPIVGVRCVSLSFIAVAVLTIIPITPVSAEDICRLRPKEPPGCFDLRLARKYEDWQQWKDAEQEYIQAGRIGARCVRIEALAAIERLKARRPKDANFELDLGDMYFGNGWWKEAERHYVAAGKDATEAQRKEVLEKIEAARAADGSFELDLGNLLFNKGWWKDAEKHYASAEKEGTAAQRKQAFEKIEAARGKDMSFELELGNLYFKKGWWKEAEKHYAAVGKDATGVQRNDALAKIDSLRGRCRPLNGAPSGDPLCSFELDLGDQYLRESAWREAEQYYAAAGRDGTEPERKEALRGIKDAREGSWRGGFLGGWSTDRQLNGVPIPQWPENRHWRGQAGRSGRHRASHSIASSASPSSVGGIVRPSSLAVLRLMTISNFAGCTTGKFEGFSPFSMRPT